MDPVLALGVGDASLEGAGREDEEEVLRLANALKEVVVELARLQPLDVDEHREAPQLQVHLQQTATPNTASVRPSRTRPD